MAQTTSQPTSALPAADLPGRGVSLSIHPNSVAGPANTPANRLRNQQPLTTATPVNQNGSFEFDRVLKSGYVQKRTQKTKTWKSAYLVLRPNNLSIYKSDKENKLRSKIYTSELSAVTPLKDPKQKRNNLFGLFSPAKNLHLEAPTLKDAQEWIDLIRADARIEQEEEEMFLTSPVVRRQSLAPTSALRSGSQVPKTIIHEDGRLASSSPEPIESAATPRRAPSSAKRRSYLDYSGVSGNEFASHSDFSDTEAQRAYGTSIESLGAQPCLRPEMGDRNLSQLSCLDQDLDRVVWQGRLWFLKSKRGVKPWKNTWAVVRPRNLILYKDESEYTASFIIPLSAIVNVVDIDPISKTKVNCMQIITDEKSYRFCAHDEESLLQCLGAFKSILTKRKELQARAAATGNSR